MVNDPDQLAGLPSHFDYIRDVVMKYTRARRDSIQKWKVKIDALSPSQLEEIAVVYRKLATLDHADDLSVWIKGRVSEVRKNWNLWQRLRNEAEDNGMPIPIEPQQEPRAKRLFDLFDYLGERGIAPFDSAFVEFRPPATVLDWSKLPAELTYLKAPALKWGRYQYSDDLLYLAKRLTVEDRRELQALADRVRLPDQQQVIRRFFKEFQIGIEPEAALVYFALGVIGEFVP